MEFQDHKHALSYPLLDHLGILEDSTTVFFQVRERPVINQPAASIVSLFSLIPSPSHPSSAGLTFVSIAGPGCSQKGPSRERRSAGFYTPSALNPHGSHHPVSQGCGSESSGLPDSLPAFSSKVLLPRAIQLQTLHGVHHDSRIPSMACQLSFSILEVLVRWLCFFSFSGTVAGMDLDLWNAWQAGGPLPR